MSRALLILSLGLGLTCAPGCGGSLAERRPDPIPAQRAAELDTLEGTIASEEANLDRLDPMACPDRCRSMNAICEASEQICSIADELREESVDLRCARARSQCETARGEVVSGCACPSEEGEASVAECAPISRF